MENTIVTLNLKTSTIPALLLTAAADEAAVAEESAE